MLKLVLEALPKNAQTTAQLHSSHTLGKVMLKILQARLQQYVNEPHRKSDCLQLSLSLIWIAYVL